MADALYIGIDNGTQGTKCAVYSRSLARILASASAPHTLIENEHGRREQEPGEWIDAAGKALDACLADPSVDRARVVGIGVSGQQHGLVALDAEGRVVRPAKLWCDTETAAECADLVAAMGGAAAVLREIGHPLAVGFTASKVLWMRRHEPENYARLRTLLLPHDYLNFWLTGRRCTECGDASGTGYFDVRRRRWSTRMLEAIDPGGRLAEAVPERIDSDEPVGTLRPAIAERFGLPPDTRVSSGGGDNMMAAIGAGNVRPGVVTAGLGTSGALYAYSERPVVDTAGELAAFCSSTGGWLPLVCTMNVTVATEKMRALLDLDVEAFDARVASAPPGAGGLLLLPYFNGERTPALPAARAVLAGMSASNLTRPNACRAAMEGATFGVRYGLDVLRRNGIAPAEMRLVGGGANSPAWRQMAAEIFGRPVICPECREAGVMGGVLQAMWCCDRADGHAVAIEALCDRHVRLDETTRAEPDPERAARYDELYRRYRALHNALEDWFRSAPPPGRIPD